MNSSRLLVIAFGLLGAACARSPSPPDPSLDRRLPQRLTAADAWTQKTKMMGFLEDLQSVLSAARADDWDAVAEAGARLGDARRCVPSHDTRGIALMAADFRCRASQFGAAALAQSRDEVLRVAVDTLGACNGCHSAYRQVVVP